MQPRHSVENLLPSFAATALAWDQLRPVAVAEDAGAARGKRRLRSDFQADVDLRLRQRRKSFGKANGRAKMAAPVSRRTDLPDIRRAAGQIGDQLHGRCTDGDLAGFLLEGVQDR